MFVASGQTTIARTAARCQLYAGLLDGEDGVDGYGFEIFPGTMASGFRLTLLWPIDALCVFSDLPKNPLTGS